MQDCRKANARIGDSTDTDSHTFANEPGRVGYRSAAGRRAQCNHTAKKIRKVSNGDRRVSTAAFNRPRHAQLILFVHDNFNDNSLDQDLCATNIEFVGRIGDSTDTETAATPVKATWQSFAATTITAYYAANPELAVGAGLHEYDGQISDIGLDAAEEYAQGGRIG